MQILNPLQRVPAIRLDWRAYFRNFCAEHGDPVPYNEKLLFQDGFQYSSTDYAGPEWPPPDDPAELESLLCSYWQIRYSTVRHELSRLEDQLIQLTNIQSARNGMLQYTVPNIDPNGQRKGNRAMPLNLDLFQERIRWLKADTANCEAKLREFTNVAQERT